MLPIPSREQLAVLTEAASVIGPMVTLGFAHARDDGRVQLMHSYPFGLGAYVVAEADVPEVLRPSAAGTREITSAPLKANPQRAIEWLLLFGGVERLVVTRIDGLPVAACFWAGFSQPESLTPEQRDTFERVARTAAEALQESVAPETAIGQLRRLERAAGLLPALLHVLDVRDVFDRLSETAKIALPHDLLLLRLFSEDLTRITIYARSDRGTDGGQVVPHLYPPDVVRAWEFDIVDDLTAHPVESHNSPTKLGARSAIRLPIRFDDRVIGGIGFLSYETARFTTADVAVARRLADHVAVGLSHYKLAERLAEGARRTEELRAQTTSLELLDEMLAALIDTGGLVDVFGRISPLAAKVLPHDAAALMVRIGETTQARLYASTGFPTGLPDVNEIPEEVLRNPDWDHDILDDLSQLPAPRYTNLVRMGFQSLLRVPIRFEGKFAGALIFFATMTHGFKSADVLVARRMADRMAVTLARDREREASKRADEATARASRLEARVRTLTDELDARTGYRRVIGTSAEWRQVLTQATQVAGTDTTVLLLGESGTGKEVVARFLHRASSRNAGPFVALNCAALPEQLLEAELFGYERGAYTGATQTKPGQLEQATGGTLFLDEVAEMSPSAQAKFLRVLQEREFQRLGGTRVLRTDARVVAATNRNLQKAIAQGQFREDLYYRLNVFAIRLPALRDRPDDVLPLSEAFLTEIGRTLGRPPGGISRDARQLLTAYSWPGNVRELRNVLERAAILCDGGLITPEHLTLSAPPFITAPVVPQPPAAATAVGPGRPMSASDLKAMERAMIQDALESARFNKSKAAKALGLTRHQLYIRLRRHGFD